LVSLTAVCSMALLYNVNSIWKRTCLLSLSPAFRFSHRKSAGRNHISLIWNILQVQIRWKLGVIVNATLPGPILQFCTPCMLNCSYYNEGNNPRVHGVSSLFLQNNSAQPSKRISLDRRISHENYRSDKNHQSNKQNTFTPTLTRKNHTSRSSRGCCTSKKDERRVSEEYDALGRILSKCHDKQRVRPSLLGPLTCMLPRP
jgi:hypothetical protein